MHDIPSFAVDKMFASMHSSDTFAPAGVYIFTYLICHSLETGSRLPQQLAISHDFVYRIYMRDSGVL
jgi:hypothetical protein